MFHSAIYAAPQFFLRNENKLLNSDPTWQLILRVTQIERVVLFHWAVLQQSIVRGTNICFQATEWKTILRVGGPGTLAHKSWFKKLIYLQFFC